MTSQAEPTLIQKVDDLTGELREVRVSVDNDRDARIENTAMLERKLTTARRSQRLSVIALVAVMLLFGWKWRDDRARDHAACEASNRSRQSSQARVEDAGSTLTDSFARVIAASNPAMTPEAADRFNSLFEQVKVDYVQHMRDNWSPDLRPRAC